MNKKFAPITEAEFKELIMHCGKKYIKAYKLAYYNGLKLKEIEEKLKLEKSRRTLQRNILKIVGKPFTCLISGFFLRKLNQGYSLDKIRKLLGYSESDKKNRLLRRIISGRVTLKTRVKVLERDKFKCVFCGRGHPNVSLQIDHIIPIVNGGKSVISNLQTLCEDCNFGKRDLIISKANEHT